MAAGTDAERLGKRLRALREGRLLTQEQLGDRAGLSGKYVSEIERGRRDVPFSTLCRLVERGLAASLPEFFKGFSVQAPGRPSSAADSGAPYEPLPRRVRELAAAVAGLRPEDRRRVMAVVRSAIALAGSAHGPETGRHER